MSFFRTGVAIATMLMGIDFAFADQCSDPRIITDPDDVPELRDYVHDYKLNKSKFSFYEVTPSTTCSNVLDIVEQDTKVLTLSPDGSGGWTAQVIGVEDVNNRLTFNHSGETRFALVRR